ncbi:MAG TPA: DUF1800 domain-containing protein [Bryobacteraceae bacterium]|nr:DUF1800 domain-containing protein [Bryobacteraceae bacterium]
MTRKQFLLAGAAITLTGCAGIPPQLLPGRRKLEPDAGPFASPASDSVDLISHVLGRLSFGARAGDYGRVSGLGAMPEESIQKYIAEQLDAEHIDDSALDHAIRRIESLSEPLGELFEYKEKVLLGDMTRAAILRAVWSKRQLYEKMAQFWTDHFNIDSSKGDCRWLKAADDREVIRRNALGRFPELLRASAASPAMLWYLDGRVNRKQNGADRPNENYARELLELHTLGIRGGYTQRDVMEVARCLTGWTVRGVSQFSKGRVDFHPEQHDDGEKSVLGQRIPSGGGEKDFDRVFEIVSLHPATARHLAEKLCRHFIADEPSASPIRDVERAFLANRGDIRAALRALFATGEFLAARRSKVKRPFEFVVSALRATQAETDAGPALFDYLVRMGHAPFQYPTPEGYSDRAMNWMGTLLWRWKFAAALSRNEIPGTTVRLDRCAEGFGGAQGFAAHILRRRPLQDEAATSGTPADTLALLLASPEFQRC